MDERWLPATLPVDSATCRMLLIVSNATQRADLVAAKLQLNRRCADQIILDHLLYKRLKRVVIIRMIETGRCDLDLLLKFRVKINAIKRRDFPIKHLDR